MVSELFTDCHLSIMLLIDGFFFFLMLRHHYYIELERAWGAQIQSFHVGDSTVITHLLFKFYEHYQIWACIFLLVTLEWEILKWLESFQSSFWHDIHVASTRSQLLCFFYVFIQNKVCFVQFLAAGYYQIDTSFPSLFR